jgi:hypothetical protein
MESGKKKEPRKKQLLIEIEEDLHNEIKVWATFRHDTLKKWVTTAIVERIKKEKSYQ